MISIEKIISGGQTGVDRAGLDSAMEMKINVGGWCPKGRRAEDGEIPEKYSFLKETSLTNYPQRTRWNVRDSDGTLILVWGAPKCGTKLTGKYAKELKKPLYIMDLAEKEKPNIESVIKWIVDNNIHILNIAGPRASSGKGNLIYRQSKKVLKQLLSLN